MNHFGLNYATFGSHEFDIKENQFKQRLQEAKFTWISSNVLNADGRSLSNVHQNLIIPFTDKKSGKSFKIDIFGLTLTTNKPDYISYTDPLTTAGNQVRQLAKTADFIIALTHQTMDDDIQLLQAYPQIGLLLGGHEHTNFQNWRGNFTPLLKADANVRSVYVIDIYYHLQTEKTEIKPTFVPINDTLTEDTTVKAVVDQWMKIAFDAFREQGFQPEQVVAITKEPLDGLASNVRNTSTNLTQLIAQSMLRAYPDTDLSIYNSGSIRIDDILPVGNITVYDVIRILPFGGNVQLASIKGHLLIKILNQGIANTGTGGFLQSANTQYINNTWHINHAPIDPQKAYKLAINDFLASGKEQGLSYLNANNKNFIIINQGKKQDIRQLVIDQLKIN
ncbi:MAG: 5'-nucleotidase C-terminal domain-containing protein [Nitrosomonas sp.]|nr:5'-nucleotidase C-terminal domain-containing protein [Nitrosomonas sp.]